LQQLASHARGRQLVAGEQPDLLCRANPIENGLDGTPRQVGQVGVFPALLDPCECQLHAADVRQDLEAVLAQSIAEIARNAIEQRVAAADQDRLPGAQRLLHLLERLGHLGLEHDLAPRQRFKERQDRRGAHDHVGIREDSPGPVCQPAQPLLIDAQDHQPRSLDCHHPCS
jgi:hypothetical protein